jgi:hypothetical protein
VFIYLMIAVLLLFVTHGVATKGVRTFVPTFVTDVYGYSLSLFGFTLGPESLANVYFSALLPTAAIVQLIAGGFTDRYDHRKVIVGMFATATLGLLALSYVQLTPVTLLLALLLVGGSILGCQSHQRHASQRHLPRRVGEQNLRLPVDVHPGVQRGLPCGHRLHRRPHQHPAQLRVPRAGDAPSWRQRCPAAHPRVYPGSDPGDEPITE